MTEAFATAATSLADISSYFAGRVGPVADLVTERPIVAFLMLGVLSLTVFHFGGQAR